MKKSEVVGRIAETVVREEKRRARDAAAAIDDYETAREGPAKISAAMDLLFTTRMTSQRFDHAVAMETIGAVEAATGKSVRELVENMDGFDAIGLLASGDGIEIVTVDEDGPKVVETDPDTTPVGDAEIPGIDLGRVYEPGKEDDADAHE